eukprot:350857-Chlamydomonas_euryale.AAC.3
MNSAWTHASIPTPVPACKHMRSCPPDVCAVSCKICHAPCGSDAERASATAGSTPLPHRSCRRSGPERQTGPPHPPRQAAAQSARMGWRGTL